MKIYNGGGETRTHNGFTHDCFQDSCTQTYCATPPNETGEDGINIFNPKIGRGGFEPPLLLDYSVNLILSV